ncbi:MAG: ATP-binding cassette domain-containing protein, partial [Candidatus Heimdallarchaeaceae archaeon]
MSEFMVETFNLSKSFQTTLAVNNVNLKIPKGSIYALLGPNGAGKTTTIRLLLGLLKPTKGKVIVNDIDVSLHSKKIRGQI